MKKAWECWTDYLKSHSDLLICISAGQDYNPVTQILEFQPGETQKNITIIINNDQRIEAAEQFELYLAGGIGVHLSPFSRTAITITNDDGKATLC